jgi:hypothetical protein
MSMDSRHTIMKLSLQVDILITTRDGCWVLADVVVVIVDLTCPNVQ